MPTSARQVPVQLTGARDVRLQYRIVVRQSRWFRLFAVVWSVWFGVVLAEPAAMHSCPAHGDHAMHLAGSAHHSGHALGSHAASRDHGTPSPDTNKPCTCLGACCCAPAVSLPLDAAALLPAVHVRVVATNASATADEWPAVAPPHSRPFANGPPAVALI